ncbi:MAG: hypothetical protein E6K18_08380 [Methanobacteriota archaeon]|nr:MAG: hypothetical protein E6K18_08380 [Euryarchaeota archaeon]
MPQTSRSPSPGITSRVVKSYVYVLVISFVGLIILLSVDWQTRSINPMVLLFGILVAGIILVGARFRGIGGRGCPACGRAVPWDGNLCPYCGIPLPPLAPPRMPP